MAEKSENDGKNSSIDYTKNPFENDQDRVIPKNNLSKISRFAIPVNLSKTNKKINNVNAKQGWDDIVVLPSISGSNNDNSKEPRQTVRHDLTNFLTPANPNTGNIINNFNLQSKINYPVKNYYSKFALNVARNRSDSSAKNNDNKKDTNQKEQEAPKKFYRSREEQWNLLVVNRNIYIEYDQKIDNRKESYDYCDYPSWWSDELLRGRECQDFMLVRCHKKQGAVKGRLNRLNITGCRFYFKPGHSEDDPNGKDIIGGVQFPNMISLLKFIMWSEYMLISQCPWKYMGRIPLIREAFLPIDEDHDGDEIENIDGRWIAALPSPGVFKHAYFKILHIVNEAFSYDGKIKASNAIEKMHLKTMALRKTRDQNVSEKFRIQKYMAPNSPSMILDPYNSNIKGWADITQSQKDALKAYEGQFGKIVYTDRLQKYKPHEPLSRINKPHEALKACIDTRNNGKRFSLDPTTALKRKIGELMNEHDIIYNNDPSKNQGSQNKSEIVNTENIKKLEQTQQAALKAEEKLNTTLQEVRKMSGSFNLVDKEGKSMSVESVVTSCQETAAAMIQRSQNFMENKIADHINGKLGSLTQQIQLHAQSNSDITDKQIAAISQERKQNDARLAQKLDIIVSGMNERVTNVAKELTTVTSENIRNIGNIVGPIANSVNVLLQNLQRQSNAGAEWAQALLAPTESMNQDDVNECATEISHISQGKYELKSPNLQNMGFFNSPQNALLPIQNLVQNQNPNPNIPGPSNFNAQVPPQNVVQSPNPMFSILPNTVEAQEYQKQHEKLNSRKRNHPNPENDADEGKMVCHNFNFNIFCWPYANNLLYIKFNSPNKIYENYVEIQELKLIIRYYKNKTFENYISENFKNILIQIHECLKECDGQQTSKKLKDGEELDSSKSSYKTLENEKDSLEEHTGQALSYTPNRSSHYKRVKARKLSAGRSPKLKHKSKQSNTLLKCGFVQSVSPRIRADSVVNAPQSTPIKRHEEYAKNLFNSNGEIPKTPNARKIRESSENLFPSPNSTNEIARGNTKSIEDTLAKIRESMTSPNSSRHFEINTELSSEFDNIFNNGTSQSSTSSENSFQQSLRKDNFIEEVNNKIKDQELKEIILDLTKEESGSLYPGRGLPNFAQNRIKFPQFNTALTRRVGDIPLESLIFTTNIEKSGFSKFYVENGVTLIPNFENLHEEFMNEHEILTPVNYIRIRSNQCYWRYWKSLVFLHSDTLVAVLHFMTENFKRYSEVPLCKVEITATIFRLKKLYKYFHVRAFCEMVAQSPNNIDKFTPKISQCLIYDIQLTVQSIKGLPPIAALHSEQILSGFRSLIRTKSKIGKINKNESLEIRMTSVQESPEEIIEIARPETRLNIYDRQGENLEIQAELIEAMGSEISFDKTSTSNSSINSNKTEVETRINMLDKLCPSENEIWLHKQIIRLSEIRNPVEKLIFEKALNYDDLDFSTHLFPQPVCKHASQAPKVHLVQSHRYKFAHSAAPIINKEQSAITIDEFTFTVPKNNEIKFKHNNDGCEKMIIVSINLNDPRYQLKRVSDFFPEASIICINEINNCFDMIEKYHIIPHGYKVYYHNPYSYFNKTKNIWEKYIFSAIVVKAEHVKNIKQIKVSGPLTTIYFRNDKIRFTCTAFYKIMKGVKSEIMEINNINEEYLKYFQELDIKTRKIHNNFILGDLNMCWNTPRGGEKMFISSLKGILNSYKNLVKGNTNFMKGKQSSSIDVGLCRSFLEIKCENLHVKSFIKNDTHNLIKFTIENTKIDINTRAKFFHRPTIPENAIKSFGLAICDTVNKTFSESVGNGLMESCDENLNYSDFVMELFEKSFGKLSPETLKCITYRPFNRVIKNDTLLVKKCLESVENEICLTGASEKILIKQKVLKNTLNKLYKRDARFFHTKKFDHEALDEHEIFRLNKFLNPKNKEGLVTKVNFKIKELKDYFLELQNSSLIKFKEITNFEIFNHYNLHEDEKFSFDNYPLSWEGDAKHNSIKKCMLSGKDRTRGLNTIVNKALLKKMPCEFADILTKFIRHNLNKGYYSDKFLQNKLVPIPKKGNASEIKNNRFLSVPNAFGSIQGKYVAACLSHFLEKNKLLFHNQFGFRAKRSCAQAIATIKLLTFTKFHGKFVLLICIDLKNAFGMISYKLILHMLRQIVNKKWMPYFESAFRQRSAVIVNNGEKSEPFDLPKVGVPQGEPTSPIFFSILIDRLKHLLKNPKYAKNCDLVCFADDTSALVAGETMEDAVRMAEDFINDVIESLAECGLEISAMKSCGMIIGTEKNRKDVKFPTEINTKSGNIKLSKEVDLLGYKMSDDLLPSRHIQILKTRLINQQNYVRNLLNYDNKSNLLLIAHSLHFGLSLYLLDILPKLTNSQYHELQKVINNTIRMILGISTSDKIAQSLFLGEIGWKSFQNFHKKAIISHLNRIIMNKCPEVLFETVTKCLRFTTGAKYQFRDGTNTGSKTVGTDYDIEALKGNRIPIFTIDPLYNQLSSKEIKMIFPFSAFDLFNKLPENIRETFGTKEFDFLINQHYTIRCQHSIRLTKNKCSSCSMGPENPENYKNLKNFEDMFKRDKNPNILKEIRNTNYEDLGLIKKTCTRIKKELLQTHLIDSNKGYLIRDDFAENFEGIFSALNRFEEKYENCEYSLGKHLSFELFEWAND